ncbi:uncharacterized protein [Musca autumnalis]|uniref:uncharacterized protein n=1 Tax=Musca autumnalis TaxID=221902 RepID=UPI003CF38F1F
MIVLCWLRGESTRWKVFVGNRVSEVQQNSNISQWPYVSTHENSADCASRGITSSELVQYNLWWSGPLWLAQSPSLWPKQPENSYETNLEVRKSALQVNSATVSQYPNLLTAYSSLTKLVRVTAYILRFLQYKPDSKLRFSGFLRASELRNAPQKLVKMSQYVDFPDEILQLQKGKSIHPNSRIAQLFPFLDDDGVLRVGGRLQKDKFQYDFKHPMLLSKNSPLSLLIFSDAHQKTLHGGLIQMQAYVTRKFWILSARNLAKRVQRQCITYFKYKAKSFQQIMGNLPSVRLQPTRPFKHSAVDYAGPITIKQSTARNSVTTKGYICLFISFRRFTSRRGICSDLYSDCGTKFIGSNKELKILQRRSIEFLPDDLANLLANNGTNWHFIPPASPNFGGLWEAGRPQKNVEVGDLVIVFDERLPPGQWPLARITETHPGTDGRLNACMYINQQISDYVHHSVTLKTLPCCNHHRSST